MTTRVMNTNGYWEIDGVTEHRLAYIKTYGKIYPGWHIHHCDGTKTNNDPSNLIALTPKHHHAIHEEMFLQGRAFARDEILAFPRYTRELILYTEAKARVARLRKEINGITAQLEDSLGVDLSWQAHLANNKEIKAAKNKKKRKKKRKNKAAKRAKAQVAGIPAVKLTPSLSPPKNHNPKPSPYYIRRRPGVPLAVVGPHNDIDAILSKKDVS